MYILTCIKGLHLASGAFWIEGEVYQMERNDINAYTAEHAKFLSHFEPQNDAAQALYN